MIVLGSLFCAHMIVCVLLRGIYLSSQDALFLTCPVTVNMNVLPGVHIYLPVALSICVCPIKSFIGFCVDGTARIGPNYPHPDIAVPGTLCG